jgi:hypothetical protein
MDDMTITSAQYVQDWSGENQSIEAVIDGVTMSVPLNAPGNRHYDEIQRQVAAGTLTIQDAD